MLKQSLIMELRHESEQTKKMLEKLPQDKFPWRPHDKSMTLGHLASHIAHIPKWITVILSSNDFDFMRDKYKSDDAATLEELLQFFEEDHKNAMQSLEKAGDEELMKPWSFKRGDMIIFTLPRIASIRTLAMNHRVHHRGQMSVYLRLLGVAVPGMYGPSADETM